MIGTQWRDATKHLLTVIDVRPVSDQSYLQASTSIWITGNLSECPGTPTCPTDHNGSPMSLPTSHEEVKAGRIYGFERVKMYTDEAEEYVDQFTEGETVLYNLIAAGYDGPKGWHLGRIHEIDRDDLEYPWLIEVQTSHQTAIVLDTSWFGVRHVRKYTFTIEEEPW